MKCGAAGATALLTGSKCSLADDVYVEASEEPLALVKKVKTLVTIVTS